MLQCVEVNMCRGVQGKKLLHKNPQCIPKSHTCGEMSTRQIRNIQPKHCIIEIRDLAGKFGTLIP